MRMNRRNVLLGLGTAVAGGGAALSTGAFSSVEAQREVDLNVVADDAAVVEITVNDGNFDHLTDSGGDQIAIEVTDAYQNAEITFDDALTFVNTSEDTEYDVTLESSGLITEFHLSDGSVETAPMFTLGTVGNDDSEDVGIVVETGESNESAEDGLTITIEEST